jgi:hypothetical protein
MIVIGEFRIEVTEQQLDIMPRRVFEDLFQLLVKGVLRSVCGLISRGVAADDGEVDMPHINPGCEESAAMLLHRSKIVR